MRLVCLRVRIEGRVEWLGWGLGFGALGRKGGREGGKNEGRVMEEGIMDDESEHQLYYVFVSPSSLHSLAYPPLLFSSQTPPCPLRAWKRGAATSTTSRSSSATPAWTCKASG